MEHQDIFAVFLADFMESNPTAVVDHAWKGDRGWVSVEPAAVDLTAREASALSIPIEIEAARPGAIPIGDRSELEMRVISFADDSVPAIYGARYDASTDSVELTAWTTEPQRISRELQPVLRSQRAKAVIGKAMTLITADLGELPTETADIHGGAEYGTCTGRFIGTKSTGFGIITAAHCTTKPATYDGATTGTSTVANPVPSKGALDLRFTALSGGVARNQIHSGPTTLLTISSVGITTSGLTLKLYGMKTGSSGGTIKSHRGCVAFTSGNTWCELYDTTAAVVQAGDSGGPWYSGSVAYGLTTGTNTTNSFVTPISYLSYISGVSAKTS
jgi:hypothetical protein